MNADSKSYFEDISGDWDQMREGFFSKKVRETAVPSRRFSRGNSLRISVQEQDFSPKNCSAETCVLLR
jgi:hypothetical protein